MGGSVFPKKSFVDILIKVSVMGLEGKIWQEIDDKYQKKRRSLLVTGITDLDSILIHFPNLNTYNISNFSQVSGKKAKLEAKNLHLVIQNWQEFF